MNKGQRQRNRRLNRTQGLDVRTLQGRLPAATFGPAWIEVSEADPADPHFHCQPGLQQ